MKTKALTIVIIFEVPANLNLHISGQWLDIVVYQDSGSHFRVATCKFGYGENWYPISEQIDRVKCDKSKMLCRINIGFKQGCVETTGRQSSVFEAG